MAAQRDQTALRALVAALCADLRSCATPHDSAEAAARCLQRIAPSVDVLSDEQRAGSADGYVRHHVHVEQDPLFSIVALVWQPGQRTPIHNHRCWGAVCVLQGSETETRYQMCGDAAGAGPHLHVKRTMRYDIGDVCSFAPPDDIHRVSNTGQGTAISLHVYGADVRALGTIQQTFSQDLIRD